MTGLSFLLFGFFLYDTMLYEQAQAIHMHREGERVPLKEIGTIQSIISILKSRLSFVAIYELYEDQKQDKDRIN